MVYPIVVVSVAVGILTFIMIKIVPSFEKIFKDFDIELPAMTLMLITISHAAVDYWWAIPAIPISLWLFIKLLRKFKAGRNGWDYVRPQGADLRAAGRERTSWPAAPAPWARWSPAACRFWKP